MIYTSVRGWMNRVYIAHGMITAHSNRFDKCYRCHIFSCSSCFVITSLVCIWSPGGYGCSYGYLLCRNGLAYRIKEDKISVDAVYATNALINARTSTLGERRLSTEIVPLQLVHGHPSQCIIRCSFCCCDFSSRCARWDRSFCRFEN